MKTILFVAMTLLSLSAFSTEKEDTYTCKYNSTLQTETIDKNFVLGADIGFVTFDQEINKVKYFFDFVISADKGKYILYYTEGTKFNDTAYPAFGVSTTFSKSQEALNISNNVCLNAYSCWPLECSLNKVP